ncbi:MAG: polysaccharide biosynthesis/export family protein [Sedimentisphaerales bacterium]|jgi:polysaccharide export outer membrane protein
MRFARPITLVVVSILPVTLTGCFSSNPRDIEAFTLPDMVDVSSKTYILHPPDEITVHCSKVPEIDLQSQQIRPDGKISFEGVGEMDAAGKTPAQVAAELRKHILDLYQEDLVGEKSVDVRVVAFRSKRYYVLGQVASPGAQVYSGRDTVIGAIALAGSPTVLAWTDRMQVIRPARTASGKSKIFEVNWHNMVIHGDMSKNVLLEDGDIIYVPPTVLAWAAMKIEEFIRPIARAFAGYYIVSTPTGAGGAAGVVGAGASGF